MRYKHQELAMTKALNNLRADKGMALLMEPGTGKTKTTLDTFMELYRNNEVDSLVVVCPKVLRLTWQDEAAKWIDGEYFVWMYDSQKKSTKKLQDYFDDCYNAKSPVIFIFNTEAFQLVNRELNRFISALANKNALLVLDESSYIKTYKAKRTRNLIQVSKYFKKRMILTGTDVTKTLLDLYAQFEFAQPGIFKSGYYGFRNHFAVFQRRSFYQKSPGGYIKREFNELVGYRNVEELLSTIEPYSFRVQKKDCFDLPEKIHQVIRFELAPIDMMAYEKFKKSFILSGEAFGLDFSVASTNIFAKLRQFSGGTIIDTLNMSLVNLHLEITKLDVLLADIEGHNESAIIWAEFRHEIDNIMKALKGNAVRVDGSVVGKERDDNIHAFQSGEVRFLVANPKAAGYGLNLQNVSMAYYFSVPLSPEVFLQSQDRIHRSGQKNTCVYKYIVAANTIDERIIEIQDYNEQLRQAYLARDIKKLESLT